MIKCSEITNVLEELAPIELAESWDNVGLLLGDSTQDIHNIMITLDITPDVVEEAIETKADLIIAHHPMIFKPLNRIIEDKSIGTLIRKLIKNDICVYTSHTNLDITWGGLNDLLASKIGLENIGVLDELHTKKLKKIVVFIPKGYEEKVRDAMTEAGAGWIGDYSDCTYLTKGIGAFKPREGTKPFIGSEGTLEKVEEYRLETLVSEEKVSPVVEAMIASHPYEEVAYDIIPLEVKGQSLGLGRIGTLKKEVIFIDFINKVKEVLAIQHLRYIGNENKSISKVAICTGSGGTLLSNCIHHNVDIYITGELKYHDAQFAQEAGLNVILAGHFETENIIGELLTEFLNKKFENRLNISQSKKNKGFIKNI